MRHTFASWALAAGDTPEWVAKTLGYVDITILMRRSMENTFIVGNDQPGVGTTIILPKIELVKKFFFGRIS